MDGHGQGTGPAAPPPPPAPPPPGPPAPPPLPPARPSHPVVLALEGTRPQRRVNVAFRFVLAIPHFLYGAALGFVGFLAVVVGWFAAVFIGRLPAGMAEFIAKIVQYFTRVQAYGYMLLTDRYPPFVLDADYAVSVHVTPERLNRAAVLFRLILLVPTWIVVQVLTSGYLVISFFVWLITLIAGRMPSALFEANAAILRYEVRFYAYAAMLTSEYPRGLFGDATEVLPGAAAPPPAFAPTPPPLPPVAAPSPPLLDVASPQPRITRLVLSRAARRVVVLVIVLGSVFLVGTNVASGIATWRSTEVLRELGDSYDDLLAANSRSGAAIQQCAVTEGGLPCVQRANAALADAFAEFVARLRQESFPGYSLDAARRVERAAVRAEEALRALAVAASADEHQARATEFERAIRPEFDEAFADLYDTLP